MPARRVGITTGQQPAFARRLQYSRPVAPEVHLKPRQRLDPGVEARELLLDLRDDALLLVWGRERQRSGLHELLAYTEKARDALHRTPSFSTKRFREKEVK
jgi:hypothetical protein